MYTFEDYKKNAEIIKKRIGDFAPEILIVLGSGLGALGDKAEDAVIINYSDNTHVLKGFAPGHKGRLVFGRLFGKNVCVMQGRVHVYEGYTMEEAAFTIRVLKLLGATKVVLTNAAGCINKDWEKGDLMLITDHIRFMDLSPLRGPNIDEFGDRFPDMGGVYTKELQNLAIRKAKDLDITLREGVYIYFAGPQYETPAEIRAARILGADAAGMSTVAEATVARHAGMDVLGFTLLTNMAAGILPVPLTGEEVIAAGKAGAAKFEKLVEACVMDM